MKKIALIISGILISIIIIIAALILLGLRFEKQYQADVDVFRLEHVEYWTGLIEEYYEKTGEYPFQSSIEDDKDVVLVRIATNHQQQYLEKESNTYRPDLDNNKKDFYIEYSVQEFVSELETVLEREIDEKYDLQKVPVNSITWYNYVLENNGYIFWAPCNTCGVTEISINYMGTAMIIVGSEYMAETEPTVFSRNDLLNHPQYIEWRSRTVKKRNYFNELEANYFNETDS